MKSYFKILAIAVVVFALLAPIGCDNSGDEEIPYNVVKATAEMFNFVGMVFEASGDYTLYFSSEDFLIIENPEEGWGTFPYTVELTALQDISPPDGEVIIKAFYFKLYLDVDEDPPWTTITITWTATLENWLYKTVSLDASFGWGGSSEGPPDTYSGTITVDGKSYSLAKVIDEAGWDVLAPDNNEEEPK